MNSTSCPSPNFDARPVGGRVDLVILHYTGMQSAAAARARLCDPGAKVSAHYLIDEDGAVARLVAEDKRAWHAGRSGWRQHDDINDVSIGIELVNPGHEWGLRPYPETQMHALVSLLEQVMRRHDLGPAAVLAHSDVAPERKEDPGELFDWSFLASRGLAIMPGPTGAPRPSGEEILSPGEGARHLAGIGYRLDRPGVDLACALRAFQRRFRPSLVDGVLDATTGLLLREVYRLMAGDGSRS